MEIHAYPNPQYPLKETDAGFHDNERSCLVCSEMFKPSARCVWTVWRSTDHSNYSNLVGYVCDVCALCPGERYPDLLNRHAANIESWITSGTEHGERAILLKELAVRLRHYATERVTIIPHDAPCPIVGI